MDPHIGGIEITDSEPDPFSETQPHAVGSKEEDSVAQLVGCSKQSIQLLNREDIRDPGSLGRFDQGEFFLDNYRA